MNKIARIITITAIGIVSIIFIGITSTQAYADKIIVIEKPAHYYKGLHNHKTYKKQVIVPRHRHRQYRKVKVVRPYGRPYHVHRFFYNDKDVYKYSAFTRIALQILDNINE